MDRLFLGFEVVRLLAMVRLPHGAFGAFGSWLRIQLNAMVKSMRTAGLKFNRRASQEAGRMIKASL